MTTDAETLAGLVSEAAGDGRPLTFEQLARRSVDPATGYRPSPNLVWRVARGLGVKMNPPLVGAIAAGLELPLERVQAAAAYEFTGYRATRVGGGVVVHDPGADVNMPKSRAVLASWEEEESPVQGNHSGE
jgi:hypothetical protein